MPLPDAHRYTTTHSLHRIDDCSGPHAPDIDVDGKNRARWRRSAILLILGTQEVDGPVTLVGLVDDPSGPIDSHPPQPGPILLIVIDEK